MDDLILDIKIIIASYDDHVWYSMYKYDKEFTSYCKSSLGMKTYVQLFTYIKNNNTEYYLFNKLHSNYDHPAQIDIYGIQWWYYHGTMHRENDQPAIICDSWKRWYIHGNLHREKDQPALVMNSCKKWYIHGNLHRENDQPAIIYASGIQEWYYHGKLHRDNDKPAIIYANGSREWFYHGQIRRDNGQPVVIYSDGRKLYHRNDQP